MNRKRIMNGSGREGSKKKMKSSHTDKMIKIRNNINIGLKEREEEKKENKISKKKKTKIEVRKTQQTVKFLEILMIRPKSDRIKFWQIHAQTGIRYN